MSVIGNAADGTPEYLAERIEWLLAAHPPSETPEAEFLRAQFDAGLAFVYFPVGYGGLGLSRDLQSFVTNRLRESGAPSPSVQNPIGYGMAAPTIMSQGSDSQKRRYLRPLFTCEEIWCQLFSESGAGSDVASLATRAVRDGDEWVVTGQKVWTTLAHIARFGMLLARTDPWVEKHNGLTYFVVDMQAPGIEVRPLRQMTGDAEFNEVYLTDVRIPDAERLSEVGKGWHAALVTLMNERVSIGGVIRPRSEGAIRMALDLWETRAHLGPVYRDRLAKLWIDAEVVRLTNIRAAANAKAGIPGPEGSVAKLAFSELNQKIFEFCVELLGPAGMLYDSYELHPADITIDAYSGPTRAFLRSRAATIEGGTSQIMRNIIGERVLGLPADVRVDKTLPWSKVPRG